MLKCWFLLQTCYAEKLKTDRFLPHLMEIWDRCCWLSSTLHRKWSKIYFNFTGSCVELENVPSLVADSQHHLSVPLQKEDFCLISPTLNIGNCSFLQSITNRHAEPLRLRSSHTLRGVINAWQWYVPLFAQHHFNVTGNLIYFRDFYLKCNIPFKIHTFGTRNRGTYLLDVGLAELFTAIKELFKCFLEKATNKPCTSTSFIFANTSSLSKGF